MSVENKNDSNIVGLDDQHEDKYVFFLTNPNQAGECLSVRMNKDVFVTPKEMTPVSSVLSVLLEDNDTQEYPTGVAYEKYRVLQYAAEFMEHFVLEEKGQPLNIPKPLFTELSTALVKSPWYSTFMDRVATNRDDLIDLLDMANYLNIPELLMLAAAKFASMLRGKSEDEIRSEWNIPQKSQ